MRFSREFFGYKTDEVRRWVKDTEKTLQDTSRQLEAALSRQEQLEANLEECRTLIAAMRRQRVLLETTLDAIEDFEMRIGPFDTIPDMLEVVDDLESMPGLIVQLRVFKERYYHLHGVASSVSSLTEVIKSRSDVVAVSVDNGIIYVVPREVPA